MRQGRSEGPAENRPDRKVGIDEQNENERRRCDTRLRNKKPEGLYIKR